MTLKPREYVMICLVPSAADGILHILKGMMRGVEAVDPAGTRALSTPEASISLVDFGLAGPSLYTPGQHVDVFNKGTRNHEATIVKRYEGQTADEYIKAGLPAGAVTSSGGVAAMAPGSKVQVTMPKSTGDHALICFLPDTSTDGSPHFARGVYATITVSGR